MTFREIATNLGTAKRLIETEDKWVRRTFYRGDAMCAYTALCRVVRNYPLEECEALARAMGSVARGEAATRKVMNFNDNNSHGKVMELFDIAIAQLATYEPPRQAM